MFVPMFKCLHSLLWFKKHFRLATVIVVLSDFCLANENMFRKTTSCEKALLFTVYAISSWSQIILECSLFEFSHLHFFQVCQSHCGRDQLVMSSWISWWLDVWIVMIMNVQASWSRGVFVQGLTVVLHKIGFLKMIRYWIFKKRHFDIFGLTGIAQFMKIWSHFPRNITVKH